MRLTLTMLATKKASALRAFITGIVCAIVVGLGWLADPLTVNDRTATLSTILAWFCLAAAAIALITAIYFTCRALAVREPQKDSDLEFEVDASGESLDQIASNSLGAEDWHDTPLFSLSQRHRQP
jgi:hypothetical protein